MIALAPKNCTLQKISCLNILYKDQIIAVVQCVSFLGAVSTEGQPEATLMGVPGLLPIGAKERLLRVQW